jgi:hypothetical protein
MIKFLGEMLEGTLYGFGFTETNLNRLQFNQEPILFDFGYASRPDLFGLVLYLHQFQEPVDMVSNLDIVKMCCAPYLDSERGITPQTLHIFPIARSIMQQFRDVSFWGYETHNHISHPKDKQLFFAGPDGKSIEQHLAQTGLVIQRSPKGAGKGFGKP